MPPQALTCDRLQPVYQCIQDHDYANALVAIAELKAADSRAALSLSAYCHYHLGDFAAAAPLYGRLAGAFPGEAHYHAYHLQTMQKGHSMGAEGQHVSTRPSHQVVGHSAPQPCSRPSTDASLSGNHQAESQGACSVLSLDAGIYEGCLLYEEGDYQAALQQFTDAAVASGNLPDLAYGRAVCCYRLGRLGDALCHVAEVIEVALVHHPELQAGAGSGPHDWRSPGSTQALRDSCLVEAFNLKLAIELQLKDSQLAQEALADMPQRPEADWDPITLHNSALLHESAEATVAVNKLAHLLACSSAIPCPSSTISNMALLLCRNQREQEAAELLDQHHEGIEGAAVSEEVREYVAVAALRKSVPAEAAMLLEKRAATHAAKLARLMRVAQTAERELHSREAADAAMAAFEAAVDAYMPVLMARVEAHWNVGSYEEAGRLLEAAAEMCFEHPTWRLNMAHTHFMLGRYMEAMDLYEPLVRDKAGALLGVTAAVLANLCVCQVLAGRNEDAEALMAAVEDQEAAMMLQDPSAHVVHLCIINLVVGTLYCAKGNLEFGVARVIKALQPCAAKLDTDTWFYAKRCLLALADSLAKQMAALPDAAATEILGFLEDVERHGRACTEACERQGASQGIGTEQGRALGPVLVEESRALRCMLRGLFGALE